MPESGMLVLGFGPSVCELEALLTNKREPATAPLPCGAKATLKDTPCPAPIVNGNEAPCKTNWELLLVAEETVTLAPVAIKVSG